METSFFIYDLAKIRYYIKKENLIHIIEIKGHIGFKESFSYNNKPDITTRYFLQA